MSFTTRRRLVRLQRWVMTLFAWCWLLACAELAGRLIANPPHWP